MIARHDRRAEIERRNLERAADDAGDELVELERVGAGRQQGSAADGAAGDLDEDAGLVLWDVACGSTHLRLQEPALVASSTLYKT